MTAAVLALAALAVPAACAEEWAERDHWQRPVEVMDALGIGPGDAVADVGAGDGYFTVHLAERVGPGGKVYAVDILQSELEGVRQRSRERRLAQVETVLGARDDPRLPAGALDAALLVNSYHEMEENDAMLQGLFRALRPGGRLGLIDKAAETGQPRASYRSQHALPPELAREDAERHGFQFLQEAPGFVRPRRGGEDWYFLVFEKPTRPSGTSAPPN